MNYNDKYQQIKILNINNFSLLIEVKEKNDEKNHYALKIIKNNLNEEYKKEIEIIKNIKSKYVIKLKDNFYDEINDGYCIVMELCNSNLRQILNKYKPK